VHALENKFKLKNKKVKSYQKKSLKKEIV